MPRRISTYSGTLICRFPRITTYHLSQDPYAKINVYPTGHDGNSLFLCLDLLYFIYWVNELVST